MRIVAWIVSQDWLSAHAPGLHPALLEVRRNAVAVVTLKLKTASLRRAAGGQQLLQRSTHLSQLSVVSWRSGYHRHGFSAPVFPIEFDADNTIGTRHSGCALLRAAAVLDRLMAALTQRDTA
jgi:hypothetical protein